MALDDPDRALTASEQPSGRRGGASLASSNGLTRSRCKAAIALLAPVRCAANSATVGEACARSKRALARLWPMRWSRRVMIAR